MRWALGLRVSANDFCACAPPRSEDSFSFSCSFTLRIIRRSALFQLFHLEYSTHGPQCVRYCGKVSCRDSASHFIVRSVRPWHLQPGPGQCMRVILIFAFDDHWCFEKPFTVLVYPGRPCLKSGLNTLRLYFQATHVLRTPSAARRLLLPMPATG